jgi:hypothetical protein
MGLQNVCSALRRNDAETSIVDARTWRRIGGYAGVLGRALVGNDHVSSLMLPLCGMLSQSDAPGFGTSSATELITLKRAPVCGKYFSLMTKQTVANTLGWYLHFYMRLRIIPTLKFFFATVPFQWRR